MDAALKPLSSKGLVAGATFQSGALTRVTLGLSGLNKPLGSSGIYGSLGPLGSEGGSTQWKADPIQPSTAVQVSVGDDVVHASFGEGVVIGSEPGGVVIVRFSADGTERKLMAEYAPIQKRN